jgi:hypothetical protein
MKRSMKKTVPKLPAGLSEQRLSIPWLIIEREGDANNLLVSAPDGTVLEYDIPKSAIAGFSLMLADNRLWNTFFSSLLNSFKTVPEKT